METQTTVQYVGTRTGSVLKAKSMNRADLKTKISWQIGSSPFSLRKHPFLLALRRWGRFARNVPSGEERGETDVFAGYSPSPSLLF